MNPNSNYKIIPAEFTKLYNSEDAVPPACERGGVTYTKHTVFLPSDCSLLTIRKPNPLPEHFFDNILVLACDNTNNLSSILKRNYDETRSQDPQTSTSNASKRSKSSKKCQKGKEPAKLKKSSNIFIIFRTYFSKRFGKYTGYSCAGDLSKVASKFWDDIKDKHRAFLLPFIAMNSLDNERRRLEKAENNSKNSKKRKEIDEAKETLETLGKYCPVPLCCRKLGYDDKNVITYVEPKNDNDLNEQSKEHSTHYTGHITSKGQKRSREIIECLESDCIHPKVKEQLGLLNEYLRNKLGVFEKSKSTTTSLEDLSLPNSVQLTSSISSTPWYPNSQIVNQTNEIQNFNEQSFADVLTPNIPEPAASTTDNVPQPNWPSTQTPATSVYPSIADIYDFLQPQQPNTLTTTEDLSFLGSDINYASYSSAELSAAIWEHINK